MAEPKLVIHPALVRQTSPRVQPAASVLQQRNRCDRYRGTTMPLRASTVQLRAGHFIDTVI